MEIVISFHENQKINQINIYAVSKMLNEKIAETYIKYPI